MVKRLEESLYTTADAGLRLARFRRLVDDGQCDAILLVVGVDSRDSILCSMAVNYLLLGYSGADLKGSSTIVDEALEDVMILIHKGGVRIYATPQMGRKFASITASWANCEVLMLDEKGMKDPEQFEEHKILCFRDMVSGFETIGVPQPGNPIKTVEKWPIIQSYALDEQGQSRGRFFTMDHKVVDISTQLESIYQQVDPHALKGMVLTSIPALCRHWETTLGNIDNLYANPRRTSKDTRTIDQIVDFIREPLETYYTYANLRSTDTQTEFAMHPPTVWFGQQTHDGTGQATPQDLHATITVHDPRSPVYWARTYFLTSGHLANFESIGNMGAIASHTNVHHDYIMNVADDVRYLLGIYAVVVTAVKAMQGKVVEGVLKSQSISEKDVEEYLKTAASLRLKQKWPSNLKVSFHVKEYGLAGPYQAKDSDKHGVTICQIGLKVDQIKSQQAGAAPLGSVTYGDSFAFNGSDTMYSLTGDIPPFEAWASHEAERLTRRNFAELSKTIKTAQPAGVDEDHPLGKMLTHWGSDSGFGFGLPSKGMGKYVSSGNEGMAFENGLLLFHARLGPFNALRWDESSIDHVTIYDNLDLNSPVMVAIYYRPQFESCVPLDLLQRMESVDDDGVGCILLCCNLHSRSKRTILAQVLPVWKKRWDDLDIPVTVVSDMPMILMENCHAITKQVKEMEAKVREMEDDDLDSGPQAQAEKQANLHHPTLLTECASLGEKIREQMTQWDAQILDDGSLGSAESTCMDDKVVSVHLIHGIPGSGKHKLANVVLAYIKHHHEAYAACLGNTMQDGIALNPALLANKLKTLMKNVPDTKVHIVLVTPGYTSAPLMLHTMADILKPLAKEFSRPIHIASSTTVINTDNFYTNHLSRPPVHLLPHVLDHCVQGFVSTILVLSPTSTVPMNQVDRILREANPHASYVYSVQALVSDMGVGMGEDGSEDHAQTQNLLFTPRMKGLRASSIPDPYLCGKDVHKLNSVCCHINNFPVGQHQVTEFMSKIMDPKQDSMILVLGRLHIEGYERHLTIVNAKAYRTSLTKATRTDESIRRDQSFFIVGKDLDPQEVEGRLRSALSSAASVMKVILNIEGKGEFVGKGVKPLLTREALVAEDINHIAGLHRDTPLADGIYFDGTYYIDFEGNRTKTRPDLEQLVLKFIDEQNVQIKLENERIANTEKE